ncbi:hypothetical protein [Roseateles asaccharophilus]|uniref:Uncharacterized protein n=1 Tax=Roseateles asaccharophilus TaxID=582607 RepID=A0ABU2A402_9BURK|nr:hypothetical protein [Roseateles asaccharophilus]MDR7331916.1 hypothetical protein [Roseateles asaccharophilus]
MRAAFSLLALVIVAAIVLSLVKKQSAALKPASTPPAAAASQAADPGALPQPQAVGQQVQGSLDEAARRAAEAASAATN